MQLGFKKVRAVLAGMLSVGKDKGLLKFQVQSFRFQVKKKPIEKFQPASPYKPNSTISKISKSNV